MRRSLWLFVAAGLLVALGLALLVSPLASSAPDGLNKVAIDEGFDSAATDHAFDDSPVAGYQVKGVDDQRLSKGLSGVIGVLLTFGLGLGLFALIRTLHGRERPADPSPLGRSSPDRASPATGAD
jgi:hypothetical protein